MSSWETSKENILPLSGGRKMSSLKHSIQRNNSMIDIDEDTQLMMEKLENCITHYVGPDPIEPWIHYIGFLQQSRLNDSERLAKKYRDTTIACMKKFIGNQIYENDKRFIEVYLKSISDQTVDKKINLIKAAMSRGIGKFVAKMYLALVENYENNKEHKLALDVLREGLKQNAQPRMSLEQYKNNLEFRIAIQLAKSMNGEDDSIGKFRLFGAGVPLESSRDARSIRVDLSPASSSKSRPLAENFEKVSIYSENDTEKPSLSSCTSADPVREMEQIQEESENHMYSTKWNAAGTDLELCQPIFANVEKIDMYLSDEEASFDISNSRKKVSTAILAERKLDDVAEFVEVKVNHIPAAEVGRLTTAAAFINQQSSHPSVGDALDMPHVHQLVVAESNSNKFKPQSSNIELGELNPLPPNISVPQTQKASFFASIHRHGSSLSSICTEDLVKKRTLLSVAPTRDEKISKVLKVPAVSSGSSTSTTMGTQQVSSFAKSQLKQITCVTGVAQIIPVSVQNSNVSTVSTKSFDTIEPNNFSKLSKQTKDIVIRDVKANTDTTEKKNINGSSTQKKTGIVNTDPVVGKDVPVDPLKQVLMYRKHQLIRGYREITFEHLKAEEFLKKLEKVKESTMEILAKEIKELRVEIINVKEEGTKEREDLRKHVTQLQQSLEHICTTVNNLTLQNQNLSLDLEVLKIKVANSSKSFHGSLTNSTGPTVVTPVPPASAEKNMDVENMTVDVICKRQLLKYSDMSGTSGFRQAYSMVESFEDLGGTVSNISIDVIPQVPPSEPEFTVAVMNQIPGKETDFNITNLTQHLNFRPQPMHSSSPTKIDRRINEEDEEEELPDRPASVTPFLYTKRNTFNHTLHEVAQNLSTIQENSKESRSSTTTSSSNSSSSTTAHTRYFGNYTTTPHPRSASKSGNGIRSHYTSPYN